MTDQQRRLETLIIVAIGKCFTEQATILTKELQFKTKFDFNNSVRSTDTFISTIENRLLPDEVEYLQGITDVFHNVISEIRKEL